MAVILIIIKPAIGLTQVMVEVPERSRRGVSGELPH